MTDQPLFIDRSTYEREVGRLKRRIAWLEGEVEYYQSKEQSQVHKEEFNESGRDA